MSGLSDVRLTLHSPQLLDEHESMRVMSTPVGLSRWDLFWHRSRTRRALLKLNAQQLQDVGLNPGLAQREGCKPFWRS